MKKIVLIFTVILLGFTLFSFLYEDNHSKNDILFIYYNVSIKNKNILLPLLVKRLKDLKKKILPVPFDSKNIDSYVISNGERSIFITENEPETKLFKLKSFYYMDIIVPVTSFKSEIENVTSELVEKIIKDNIRVDYKNVIKMVENGSKKLGVIPYNMLSLKVKPVMVNGIFPTINNVKNGKYPFVIRANLSTNNKNIFRHLRKEIDADAYNRLFSIVAGGDIMLDRGVKGYISRYGSKYPFKYIREIIKNNSIAFANLESPITRSTEKYLPDKGIYFKVDPAYANAIKWCGFDILSISNNHIMDWGINGVIDTMRYLNEMNIKYTGVNIGEKWNIKPVIFNIKKTKVCFLAINDIYPVTYRKGHRVVSTYTYDERMRKYIKHLSNKCDILIISYHTGIEYRKNPEREKIEKMKLLIREGADIIIGGHPHVVQNIEVYNEKKVIAYSVGNLIFDQNWSEETSTGLLLEFGFNGQKILYIYPLKVKIYKGQAKVLKRFRELEIVFNK